MEHSYIGNNFVRAIEGLIAKGGKWHGDRIVWAGDYADPENPKVLDRENEDRPMNLYDIVGDNKIKPAVPKRIFKYLLNLDTKEFVDMEKVPNTDVWKDDDGKEFGVKIHPLPLLTCEGNGRGGGDYHGESELIGKWARDRIIVDNKVPEDFNELIFDLVE
jgi:hypothetical protein